MTDVKKKIEAILGNALAESKAAKRDHALRTSLQRLQATLGDPFQLRDINGNSQLEHDFERCKKAGLLKFVAHEDWWGTKS